MLIDKGRGCRGASAYLLPALLLSATLTGCTALQDPPPVSELEPPTWEIGQEWHYKESNGQWQNWTVVGLEEHRGFETYRVRIDYSFPDKFGRNGGVTWFDRITLGIVERLNGLNRTNPMATASWFDTPFLPRFPFSQEPTVISGNATVVSGGDWWNVSVVGIQTLGSWTDINTPQGALDAVEIETMNPESNISSVYWYSPEVEHYARYVYPDEGLTFNLTYWVMPD